VEINKIYFSCNLQLPDPTSWVKRSTMVQFKTSMMDFWVDLVQGKMNDKGSFEAFYEIPSRISTSNLPLRAFREILEAGGVPDLRLVTETDFTESIVLVQSGDFKYDNEETLHYAFRAATIIEESMWPNIPTQKGYSETYKLISKVGASTSDDMATEMENLKSQISQQKLQIEALEAGEKSNPDIDALKTELEKISASEKEATNKLKELQSEKSKLEKTVASNLAQIDQLTTQLNQKEIDQDNHLATEGTTAEIASLKKLVDNQKLEIEASKKEGQEQLELIQKKLIEIDDLNNALEAVKTTEEEAKKNVEELQLGKTTLEQTIKSNVAQIDQLTTQISQKEAELADKNTVMAAEAMTEITDLRTLVGEQKTQLEAFEAEEEEKLKAVETNLAEIGGLQSELADVKVLEEETKKELEELQLQKTSLEQTIQVNVAQIDQLTAEINQKDAELTNKDNQIDELEGQVTQLSDQINTSTTQEAATPFEAKALPASTVYSSILSELQKTKEISVDSGYRLANLSLNLKTTVEQDDDGMRLQLVDAKGATDLNTSAISDISVSIVDDNLSTATTNSADGTPSVVGLTETAARKRLQSFGLRLNPVYEYNSTKTIGQAIKQSPTPEEAYVSNQAVTVVFSKK